MKEREPFVTVTKIPDEVSLKWKVSIFGWIEVARVLEREEAEGLAALLRSKFRQAVEERVMEAVEKREKEIEAELKGVDDCPKCGLGVHIGCVGCVMIEKMKKAVLAERKRCAEIARKHGAKVDGHCACMDEIADAILEEPEGAQDETK